MNNRELRTPETHPDDEVIGRWFVTNDWRSDAPNSFAIYYCDSYDPRIGYWMTEENGTDQFLRTNVSERAIGRTFHRIYEDGYCQWPDYGRRGAPADDRSEVNTEHHRATGREAHLAWAKQRALEIVDQGDIEGALASLLSDLRKYPGTDCHDGIQLTAMLLAGGHLREHGEVRRHIEGFM